MKNKFWGLIIGLTISIIAIIPVYSYYGITDKNVEYRNINIILNGIKITPRDTNGNSVEPFIIDGTTYLPVRAIAKEINLNVKWDDNTNTIYLDNYNIKKEIDYILNGSKDFIDFETGSKANIYSLPTVNELFCGEPHNYAIVDLDRDNESELIVNYSMSGDVMILDKQGETWYSYAIPFRGILNLKIDGTMNGSSGASSNSIHYLHFNEYGCSYINIVTCDDLAEIYLIGEKMVSKEECMNKFKEQHAKNNVKYTEIIKN